jgi:PPP family 3-phenylpropionic acid transporter
LVVFIVLSSIATLSYLGAHGFWLLFAVNLLHAAALAPITVLSDALAVGAASSRTHLEGFEYGWVRGTGSAVFIAGTLLSGQAVGAFGLSAIAVLQASLLAAAAFAALHVPELVRDRTVPEAQAPAGGVRILLRERRFRTLVLFAALVLGSHALHDGFAVLRWSAAGISPAIASVLWSESVAAEVVVFFVIGPQIIARLTPAGALATAALAGIVRWSVAAQTTHIAALALVQPLHGITFALLHLACMRLITRIVPTGLEGTAQAIYATVGIGLTSALLTIVSGILYARLGGQAFWMMAALCMLALPLTWKLRETRVGDA